MKFAFVVNDLQTELATYTTTRLAMAAVNRGHKTYTFGVGDFICTCDGSIHALGRTVRAKSYKSLDKFLADLQSSDHTPEHINLDEFDAVLLRNDPSTDAHERPWAQSSGILFGQLVATRGVMVLNDPENLARAINKTYFQQFPEEVRPTTCISRNVEQLKQFISDQHGKVVLKPLQGSGGNNVFLVGEDERANLNQMLDAVLRDGYCVAQEYLPAAAKGDVRLFVMNGRPLERNGKFAAFRRINKTGDARSNMHTGGESEPIEVTEKMLKLVEIVRPKLINDGMFLVGLDIVADKLIEINVFSPGGLGSSSEFAGIDFAQVVIEDLERKVEHRKYYNGRMPNSELATF
ncbi:MAG TPA: glutathione synthetase [Lacipirellulaceae bacterium]|jgi:glutathione synthase|nr:glutathione synthetase [Lacipirellulaceae bacterium]